jgi:hypothetical protein
VPERRHSVARALPCLPSSRPPENVASCVHQPRASLADSCGGR